MTTDYSTNNNNNTSSTSPNTTTVSTAAISPTSSSSISSSRHTKNISTSTNTTNLDYASSSFDEGEESDSYDIRRFDQKYNNHRWSVSSSSSNSTTHGFNYPSHKRFEVREDLRNNHHSYNNSGSSNININNNNNNNNLLLSKSIHNSRIRGGRKWETDDESLKTNYNRHSLPIQSSHVHHHHSFDSNTTNSPINTNASTYSAISNTTNGNNNKNNNISVNNNNNNNNNNSNNNNNNIDETNTTRSLLYLLNKEREKRRELQTAYDQTLQKLQDLEKTHSEDISALESDIQTLKKALVKESKSRIQLNKLYNEAHEKFGEDMQIWANKVIIMENQGNEMQETFKETISQLEKGEVEILRLRKENQMLRDQLLNNNNNSNNNNNNNNNSNNIQDFMKIINNNSSNSIEEQDEFSKESKNTNDPIESSDAESVVTCSKITKLNNRIIELESELSIKKESESDKQIAIKQLEEKQEKQEKNATLLRANIARKQKIIDDLNQELRKVRYSEGKREEKQKLLLKQNSFNLVKEEKEKQDVVENSESSNNNNNNVNNNSGNNRTNQSKLPKPRGSSTIPVISYSSSKDRKTSLTNSDSIEAASSKKSLSVKKDKDKIEDVEDVEYVEYVEVEVEQPELLSEEEEEEERDDKSSLCTGSENWAQSRIGSEENSSLQDPNNELGEDDNRSNSNSNNSNSSSNNDKNNTIVTSTIRNHQHRKFNSIVENEDDMLDAILSDMEDRMLPLIGHYSAAEFTEDEDYTLDGSAIGGNNYDDDLFDRSISRRHSLASRFSGGSGGGRNAKLKFK